MFILHCWCSYFPNVLDVFNIIFQIDCIESWAGFIYPWPVLQFTLGNKSLTSLCKILIDLVLFCPLFLDAFSEFQEPLRVNGFQNFNPCLHLIFRIAWPLTCCCSTESKLGCQASEECLFLLLLTTTFYLLFTITF